MNALDEELLRSALERAVPHAGNPQRIEQIKRRVRVSRRRRMAITGATAAVVVASAAVVVPGLLTADPRQSTASRAASWHPANAVTSTLMQQIADSQEQGWQLASDAARKGGPKMIAFYEPEQSPAAFGAAQGVACTSAPDTGTCADTPQQLDSGAVLILYGPLSTGLSLNDVRPVTPVERWCGQIGGTQELVAAAVGDTSVLYGGYACLKDATPTVAGQAENSLIVGYLPDSTSSPSSGG